MGRLCPFLPWGWLFYFLALWEMLLLTRIPD